MLRRPMALRTAVNSRFEEALPQHVAVVRGLCSLKLWVPSRDHAWEAWRASLQATSARALAVERAVREAPVPLVPIRQKSHPHL